ncbi:MAG TPA: signal peptide peptidase SppA [Stellaceae bacterium]|nr:signal peptide peptidase SppA [Stellaceae bacterium]
MRRVVIGLLAAIGLVVVLLFIGGVVYAALGTGQEPLPERILLTVDLTNGLSEGPRESPLLRLIAGTRPNLRDVLDGIEAAARDPRVKGLYARVGDDVIGLATIEELRDAIADFRAKGKFAIAYADSFGEFGSGTRPYYLAAAFDEIWLQPVGMLGLTGLYSEVPFFKNTLALLGVTPSFSKREEFKTAIDSLTETRMTPPYREEVDAIIASLGDQIIDGVARGRGLSPGQVRQEINNGPFFATEAWQARLVDRLGYRDEALAHARRRAGSGAERVSLASYLDHVGRADSKAPKIALIYGTGLIAERGNPDLALFGGRVMSARAMEEAFRAAVRDPEVRAILFRIDSPGGSVVASESIWRDVVFARERGKPVIVSMGDVAGSGGYYVAAAADKIVAEPATLTGSIGVFAGKLVLSGLYKKLGITTDSAQLGNNAGMFSAAEDFSAAGHRRLETILNLIYSEFKDRVATGRQMTLDKVEEVAKGRVWTGADAKARGLVDALGGYRVALRLARQAAGIPPAAPVALVVYPKRKSLLDVLYDRLTGKGGEDGEEIGGAAALVRAVPALLPLLQQLAPPLRAPGVLTMPPVGAPR